MIKKYKKKIFKNNLSLIYVIRNIFKHYFQEDGAAYASHMTLSGLLAIFPFLIFATNLSSFLGAWKYLDESVHYIFTVMPSPLAQGITSELINILTEPHGKILTLSFFATAYFASNGIEALRTALNRSFRVYDKRSIIFCRIQSLFFVVLATLGLGSISILLVLAPFLSHFIENLLPDLAPYVNFLDISRYFIAIIILFICIAAAYKWLPAGKRTFRQILPGAFFTLCSWFLASLLFSQYLIHFANYVSTYSDLASIMIALIFLYILSAIFILGSELNAVLIQNGYLKSKKCKT